MRLTRSWVISSLLWSESFPGDHRPMKTCTSTSCHVSDIISTLFYASHLLGKNSATGRWSSLHWYLAAPWTGSAGGQKMLSLQVHWSDHFNFNLIRANGSICFLECISPCTLSSIYSGGCYFCQCCNIRLNWNITTLIYHSVSLLTMCPLCFLITAWLHLFIIC